LDDLTNFESLFSLPGPHTWNEFLYYILNGFAGPSGRPASLVTFYLNFITSGQDPWFYKLTNIFIHLANGFLIYLLILSVLNERYNHTRKNIAVFASVLWLLHPLHVSTTLYVVQRMTQLSSLCVLAGLLRYIHLRKNLHEKPDKKNLIKLLVSLSGFTVLAILFKENGALLPVFALLIERFFLAHRYSISSQQYRQFIYILLYVPLLLILAYLVYVGFTLNPSHSAREFTPYQRLLTESRILLDYLRQIIVPDISVMGIYHDDYILSSSLFSPLQTVFAVTGIFLLGIIAFLARRRFIILSFAISWFLLGHVLEGTVIPLELYFEHRNYLPSIGPIFLAAYGIFTIKLPVSRIARNSLSLVIILTLSFATYLLSNRWGNESIFIQTAYESHPRSPRANIMLLNRLLQTHNFKDAYVILSRLETLQPSAISTSIYRLTTDCLAGSEPAEGEFKQILKRFASGLPSKITQKQINNLINLGSDRRCANLRAARLLEILASLRNNSLLQTDRFLAFSWESEAYVLSSSDHADVGKILKALDKSILIEPTVDRLLWRAKISIIEKNFDIAIKYVNQAELLANKRIILNNDELERIKYYKDTLLPNAENMKSERAG
jgi:hypothetical protein